MTIYEQMQSAVKYIEENLFSTIRVHAIARHVHMSTRAFYNYFWAVCGFTCKEYVVKRRLSESLKPVEEGEERIIDIALRVGYETHEAFSRAFKKEFGITPIRCRECRPALTGLGKMTLIKEMYMGVVVKELPELSVLEFDGFAPEPENKARAAMNGWLTQSGYAKPYRIFGHNIDREGRLSHDPQNVGYRFLLTVEPGRLSDVDRAMVKAVQRGRYAVTGIEGVIGSGGDWIGEGWRKIKAMMKDKGWSPRRLPRWLEEELEPSQPGNLRLDLYVEID